MKIAKIILSGFLIFAIILFPSFSNSATESLDQNHGCTHNDGGDSLGTAGNFPMYQVFTPSKNRLTKVRLSFGGAGNPIVTVTIKNSGGTSLGATLRTAGTGDYDFVFTTPINLTSGSEYQIHLNFVSGATLTWLYCQPGNYTSGHAVTGGVIIPDKDYHFQTYGYTETPPPPPDDGDGTTIRPPTNVEAEDVPDDTGGSVYIHWNKSTSAIDGYRIYRRKSEESKEDYVLIKELTMMPLSYEDTGLENGTEYTYMMRSYKGGDESEDSNETTVTPENNLAPPTPENLKIRTKGKDFIEVSWDRVDDEKLDKYVLRYGENPDEDNYLGEVEISKNQTSYQVVGLSSGIRYYLRIASRSAEGETSEFSDFVTEETDKEKGGISWVWITSLIVLALAVIGIYLYIAYRKRWWPFKKKTPPDVGPKPPTADSGPKKRLLKGETL